ncbi:unnamed protein product [Rhodiola kirilowii]
MAGGCWGIRVEDGVDRISELPVHLREHILDCLNIKDAVSTSILSNKWRYCWTGLRKLVFDEDFWDFDEDLELVDLLEHVRAIDRVLMLHRGPIREFTLLIPQIENITVDINMWLCVLSNNVVQKIEIDAVEYEEPGDNCFPMPSCLFHCRELEKLSLHFCKLIRPSDFKGFANLTRLSLNHVDIAPSLLESLISGCLLLETLTLEYLMLKGPFSLETLNLKTFYFNDHSLEFIIFKDNPKLTYVSLLGTTGQSEFDRTDTPQLYSTLECLCSLSMIKKLTYDFFLLEPLPENCPSSTPTPLENLKCLTLRSVDVRLSKDILFTLCLLRSAPNLQNLTIDLYCDWDLEGLYKIDKEQGAAEELLKSEAQKHTSYDSIQTLTISAIKGLPNEKLLIELLQTRCPKVKSIVTKRWVWQIDGAFEMNVQAKP